LGVLWVQAKSSTPKARIESLFMGVLPKNLLASRAACLESGNPNRP
jgi:hypothetical protein